MTEAEWLACADPTPMLQSFYHKASNRKLRLFAVECCRRSAHLVTNDTTRLALSCAERFAEQLATGRERREMYARVSSCAQDFGPDEAVADALHRNAYFAAEGAADWAAVSIGAEADFMSSDSDHVRIGHVVRAIERLEQAKRLRDILGNPFRPVALNSEWLTSDVVALAKGIYEERAFDRMPILADAMQDAGCDNEDVLSHCRGPGPHVRGCWVVDLILGKS
jgi:hypothetical protein